jgi:hypothetical protein
MASKETTKYVLMTQSLCQPYSVVAVQGACDKSTLEAIARKYSTNMPFDRVIQKGPSDYMILSSAMVEPVKLVETGDFVKYQGRKLPELTIAPSEYRSLTPVIEEIILRSEGNVLIGVTKGTGDEDHDYRSALLEGQLWVYKDNIIQSPAVKKSPTGKLRELVSK